MTDKKVTLIVRSIAGAWRTWDAAIGDADLVFVDSPAFLPNAIDQAIKLHKQEVVRVVIDRVGTPIQFLQVLSALPHEFLGDVLFVRSDGESFLSAVVRGGDRVLYSLKPDDVTFYLKTTQLIGEEVDEAAVRQSKA